MILWLCSEKKAPLGDPWRGFFFNFGGIVWALGGLL